MVVIKRRIQYVYTYIYMYACTYIHTYINIHTCIEEEGRTRDVISWYHSYGRESVEAN